MTVTEENEDYKKVKTTLFHWNMWNLLWKRKTWQDIEQMIEENFRSSKLNAERKNER